MKSIFNNAPKYSIIAYLVVLAILLSLAIFTSSCKSRKVQKDYSKSVDKTGQSATVREIRAVRDTVKKTANNNVKESSQSNKTFDTEQTTTILYDTLERVKIITIVKKSKGQNSSKSEKSDQRKIDFIYGRSEIKDFDSTGVVKNNKKEIIKEKKTDAKINWLQIGVGAGMFVLVSFIAFIAFKKSRPV